MRDSKRGVLRYSTKELCVAALVAAASFGAGLAWSASAHARVDGEPRVEDVGCLTDCDGDAAAVGSVVELTGRDLGLVEVVKFTSDEDRRVKAEPDSVSGRSVEVTVPDGAVTGPPRVKDSAGSKATSPVDLEISEGGDGTETMPTSPTEPDSPTDTGDGGSTDSPSDSGDDPVGDTSPDGISVDPDKGFFKGKRLATAHVSGSISEIEVVSAADGTPVATVPVAPDSSGASVAKWDGVTDAGEVAANGEYEFRAASGDSASFEQYDHIFPVNGPHEYGDGLGAGRDHQGQDVFADCGTKLVAARAGKVETNTTHEAAGNYVVVHGKKTDTDYVYMHLAEPSPIPEGEKVKTGEAIGLVGETGNASGCHLHFEMWDTGWQEGSPADPAPELKKWDEWS